jgi:molybdopterin molybdotransferase
MTTPAFHDVRMRGFRDRAEVDEVIHLIDAQSLAPRVEKIPLTQAASRVLASDIVAELAIPPFDRAAMDGYALRAEQTFGAGDYNPLELAIVGEALPGRAFAQTVSVGQAVRIMTGAPIPPGADAVLPVEQASELDGRLRVTEPVPPGRHIGRRGEDIAIGTTVLHQGRRLRPQDLGLLTSLGVAQVNVFAQPRVQILVTGNELLPPGSIPSGFQIVDSNSPMLAALVARDGGASTTIMVADSREAITQQLLSANFDVLLVSGGSSVGKEDHAPSLLAELGKLLVHGVALRPAAPAGVGVIEQKLVFLLPGNPVSCLCAYDLFAARAVRRLAGLPSHMPYSRVCVPLANKVSSAIGRVDYVRVRLRNGRAEPLAVSGASILSTTTVADGFALVPRDLEGYAAGEMIEVHLYDAP